MNAHYQNGRVEKQICDLCKSTRSMLLHAMHRWPKAIHLALWPMALLYITKIRNSLPRNVGQNSPLSQFAGTDLEPDLKHFHKWGALAYVLSEPLQSGNSLPRWTERSRVGVFLGHSPEHASSVSYILNTTTGCVSPQFHVVYNDKFKTVGNDCLFQSLWQRKAKLQLNSQKIQERQVETRSFSGRRTRTNLRQYGHSQVPLNLTTPWEPTGDPRRGLDQAEIDPESQPRDSSAATSQASQTWAQRGNETAENNETDTSGSGKEFQRNDEDGHHQPRENDQVIDNTMRGTTMAVDPFVSKAENSQYVTRSGR